MHHPSWFTAAFFALALLTGPRPVSGASADVPEPRMKSYSWMSLAKWREFHKGDLARAAQGPIDVLFLGDSITEAWEKNGAKVWAEFLAPLGAANFGIGGDTTQNLLWRITEGGAIDRVRPKVVVVLIGTNNLGLVGDDSAEVGIL